jgi:hypothetical protein
MPLLAVSVAAVGDIASVSTAIFLGFSGLTGGVLHYGAVLARLPERDVDFSTAIGFFSRSHSRRWSAVV